MSKLKTLSKTSRRNYLTYGVVILAYIILQALNGSLSSSLKGMLVPICAYVVMAVSLNLTVGVLGELSLGHAGFMSMGAFTGTAAAMALQDSISSVPLRLAVAMVIGAVFAAIAGVLIGIPVLRLNGDYLAIVTLAFGEIIKSISTTSIWAWMQTGFMQACSVTRRIWARAESSSSQAPWALAASPRSPPSRPVLFWSS